MGNEYRNSYSSGHIFGWRSILLPLPPFRKPNEPVPRPATSPDDHAAGHAAEQRRRDLSVAMAGLRMDLDWSQRIGIGSMGRSCPRRGLKFALDLQTVVG